MERPQTHREVIKALGGPVKLARRLDLSHPIPTTVHWSTRGIPARYWHRVADMLTDQGHVVTAAEIERMPIASAEAA